MKMSKSITVPAKREELNNILAFAENEFEAHCFPPKAVMQLNIAIEEIFVNIASYAYGENIGEAEIYIDICDNPLSVSIRFQDSGRPYNPIEKADPDITLNAEERSLGGLGIFMVKKSMDCIEYENKNGKNILTIKKNIV